MQLQVLNKFKKIIFWLKLFDLNQSDLFIGRNYLILDYSDFHEKYKQAESKMKMNLQILKKILLGNVNFKVPKHGFKLKLRGIIVNLLVCRNDGFQNKQTRKSNSNG